MRKIFKINEDFIPSKEMESYLVGIYAEYVSHVVGELGLDDEDSEQAAWVAYFEMPDFFTRWLQGCLNASKEHEIGSVSIYEAGEIKN